MEKLLKKLPFFTVIVTFLPSIFFSFTLAYIQFAFEECVAWENGNNRRKKTWQKDILNACNHLEQNSEAHSCTHLREGKMNIKRTQCGCERGEVEKEEKS